MKSVGIVSNLEKRNQLNFYLDAFGSFINLLRRAQRATNIFTLVYISFSSGYTSFSK